MSLRSSATATTHTQSWPKSATPKFSPNHEPTVRTRQLLRWHVCILGNATRYCRRSSPGWKILDRPLLAAVASAPDRKDEMVVPCSRSAEGQHPEGKGARHACSQPREGGLP